MVPRIVLSSLLALVAAAYAHAQAAPLPSTGPVAHPTPIGAPVAPTSPLYGSPEAATRLRVGGWYVPWDRSGGLSTLSRNADIIGAASPFWFELAEGGRVNVHRTAGDAALLRIARREGLVLTPTISNSYRPERVAWVVRHPIRRAAHVAHLVTLVADPAYAGLDVDYENVAPRDRAAFTLFVTELADALHARGKILSVTVMPKTRDDVRTGPSAAMDYAAIGQAADQVRVMAYDYSWRCSRPGPIGPLPWVRAVVAYSASRVAPSKLVLGIPLYAYRWPVRGCGSSRVWQVVARERRNPKARNGYSRVWATPMVRVGRHTTWYEDARSIRAKAQVAQEFGLAGVYAWRLGGEDPAVWNALVPVLSVPTTPSPLVPPTS